MKKKKVIIVGAGPGGLAAGMMLASKDYEVCVFERKETVGGRNFPLKIGDFTFDLGPTFFLMVDVLEEIFAFTGRKMSDYLTLQEIDPLYRLKFKDVDFNPSRRDQEFMKKQMEAWIPGSYSGYQKYLKKEKVKFDTIIPCLRVPYHALKHFFSWQFIRSIPKMDAHISLFTQLGRYFKSPDMRVAFSFQAKYLGMSPWSCPGTFSILSYIEHSGGIYHVKGGLNQLSASMAKVIEEEGGKIHTSTEVEKILVEDGKATGVLLKGGEKATADHIVINADFAYAMDRLVKKENRPKYTSQKLRKKKYSCSTFMLYLGMKKIYDIPHHNIIFADDYKKNIDEIANTMVLSKDPSFYLQNASITDDTLAPEGKSTIYVLVPVPNQKSGIDWEKEKEPFKERILDLMEQRAGIDDIRNQTELMKIITPDDWEKKENVFLGATFNLAHTIDQMLYFRPHNKFEEFRNCYLVGGGTHPGSGLPTIYESGNISAKLIMERDGITFDMI